MLAIVVNTFVDERDGNITTGDVSLRDAIELATAGETIEFSTNLQHGLNGATITLLSGTAFGEIAFNKNLTIDASMLEDGITIDGSNVMLPSIDKHRIFKISGGASTLVTMKNLKLKDGEARSENGGAILSTASLTLENCSISDSRATSNGGGLHFDGGSGSALTLKSTSISGNTCGGIGGGLYVDASAATVTIENSTISGNDGQGGGVAVMADEGNVTIKNSAIVDNDGQNNTGFAAGLHISAVNNSEVDLINVLVTLNEAADGIGGVYINNSNSQVTITDCTISENKGRSIFAFEVGGGLHIHGLGSSTTTIQNTTISGNQLLLPAGPRTPGSFTDYMSGSGMDLEVESGSNVVVRNSTISGNQAAGSGAGVEIGEFKKGGHVSFEHSTITENHANMDNDASGSGGGIFFEPGTTTTVELDHTIVAKNYRGSGDTTFDDITDPISHPIQFADVTWSLIGTNANVSTVLPATPTGQADANGNRIGSVASPIDPLLGPLTYNGGPVIVVDAATKFVIPTHALLPNGSASPAINAGNPNAEAGIDGVPEFDQRGNPWKRVDVPNNVPNRIDIGAFEKQPNPLPGDYNFNGVVDAADYSVWRDTFTPENTTDLRADGDDSGVIGVGDYQVWKTHFGENISDFDGSGATDIADYVLWQSTNGSTTDLRADANEDGVVDDADYEIWFDTYGSTVEIAQFGLLSSLFDPDAPPAVVGITLGLPGVGAMDFAKKVGSGEQIRSVPLIAANTLHITFSRDVNVAANALQLVNLDGSSPTLFAFSYDPLAQTATWTFNTSLANGRYLVRLSDSVEDLDGKTLDGEFFNPTKLSDAGTAVFPSGDGDEGGEFRFRFTVLSGDSDHNNIDGAANYVNWQSTEPGMIIVSTTTDEFDGNLTFGDVSLREAVNYANLAGSATTIQLPAGRYYLTRTGTESTTNTDFNDLDILGDVTIVGAGPGASIIDPQFGSWMVEPHRGFDITGSGRRLHLSRVTITGSMITYYSSGGAAFVSNQGALELTDSAIVFNGQYTGGVNGVGIRSSGGDLTIERTVFTNNNGYDGSAIFSNVLPTYNGSLTIGESIFALNTSSMGTPNVKVTGAVAKTNRGKNLFDSSAGGFFDVVTGAGDYQGTPHYVVTTLADTFNHADDVESLSIREAVDKANLATGQKEIWVPAWRFTLTRDRGTNATDTDVSYGDLDVKKNTVVRGVADRTSIAWKPGVADKVFDLLGNYDQGGQADYSTVNAGDYAIWQAQNGSSGGFGQFSADGDDDGDVDADDYAIWSANYGHTLLLFEIDM